MRGCIIGDDKIGISSIEDAIGVARNTVDNYFINNGDGVDLERFYRDNYDQLEPAIKEVVRDMLFHADPPRLDEMKNQLIELSLVKKKTPPEDTSFYPADIQKFLKSMRRDVVEADPVLTAKAEAERLQMICSVHETMHFFNGNPSTSHPDYAKYEAKQKHFNEVYSKVPAKVQERLNPLMTELNKGASARDDGKNSPTWVKAKIEKANNPSAKLVLMNDIHETIEFFRTNPPESHIDYPKFKLKMDYYNSIRKDMPEYIQKMLLPIVQVIQPLHDIDNAWDTVKFFDKFESKYSMLKMFIDNYDILSDEVKKIVEPLIIRDANQMVSFLNRSHYTKKADEHKKLYLKQMDKFPASINHILSQLFFATKDGWKEIERFDLQAQDRVEAIRETVKYFKVDRVSSAEEFEKFYVRKQYYQNIYKDMPRSIQKEIEPLIKKPLVDTSLLRKIQSSKHLFEDACTVSAAPHPFESEFSIKAWQAMIKEAMDIIVPSKSSDKKMPNPWARQIFTWHDWEVFTRKQIDMMPASESFRSTLHKKLDDVMKWIDSLLKSIEIDGFKKLGSFDKLLIDIATGEYNESSRAIWDGALEVEINRLSMLKSRVGTFEEILSMLPTLSGALLTLRYNLSDSNVKPGFNWKDWEYGIRTEIDQSLFADIHKTSLHTMLNAVLTMKNNTTDAINIAGGAETFSDIMVIVARIALFKGDLGSWKSWANELTKKATELSFSVGKHDIIGMILDTAKWIYKLKNTLRQPQNKTFDKCSCGKIINLSDFTITKSNGIDLTFECPRCSKIHLLSLKAKQGKVDFKWS